jgi:flagellar assembly factor FliW
MIIHSKRFGSIEVNEDRIIKFDDGLLGFNDLKQFVLADDPADISMPFKWLISLERPEVVFLVTDPGIFFKDYVFDLPEEDGRKIDAKSEDDVSVITILTVPADPKQITANLRGPLVINWRTLVGRQVILKDTDYTTKHYVFIQKPENTAGGTKDSGLDATNVTTVSSAARAHGKGAAVSN